VGCSVENVAHRDRQALVAKTLVDTGSEYTWLPQDVLSGIGIRREKKDVQFVMANGTTVTRGVGFAIIRIGEHFTVDEVVFAERGDLALLGARTLEGLSLVVDPRRKKLVAAGPIPAA
jgi:predicted aspartyl protease